MTKINAALRLKAIASVTVVANGPNTDKSPFPKEAERDPFANSVSKKFNLGLTFKNGTASVPGAGRKALIDKLKAEGFHVQKTDSKVEYYVKPGVAVVSVPPVAKGTVVVHCMFRDMPVDWLAACFPDQGIKAKDDSVMMFKVKDADAFGEALKAEGFKVRKGGSSGPAFTNIKKFMRIEPSSGGGFVITSDD